MVETHIEVTCEGGHRQIIKLAGESFTKQYVEGLAGLLDGTSPMYLYPPGEDSPIGKCATCGKKLKATILGYAE